MASVSSNSTNTILSQPS